MNREEEEEEEEKEEEQEEKEEEEKGTVTKTCSHHTVTVSKETNHHVEAHGMWHLLLLNDCSIGQIEKR